MTRQYFYQDPLDQVLEYTEGGPGLHVGLLLYKLIHATRERVDASELSKREIIRHLFGLFLMSFAMSRHVH